MFGFGILGAVCDAAFGTDTCGVSDEIGSLGFAGDDFGYHASDDMLGLDSSSTGSSFDCCAGTGIFDAQPCNFDAATMGFESWVEVPGLWSDPGVGGFDGMGGGTAFGSDPFGMD